MIPDAEMVAVTLLREALDVPVYISPPKDIPGTYVRITRLGGVQRNIVTDSALIEVNSYSRDGSGAAEVAGMGRLRVRDSAGTRARDAGIRFWREVSVRFNYPQPDVDRDRYQFSGVLRLVTN